MRQLYYEKKQAEAAVKYIAEHNPYASDNGRIPLEWAQEALNSLLRSLKADDEIQNISSAGFHLQVFENKEIEINVHLFYEDTHPCDEEFCPECWTAL